MVKSSLINNSYLIFIITLFYSPYMKKIILIALLLFSISSATVSLRHLQSFFNTTYDKNRDGYATIQQFVQYYQFMEPEHNLTEDDIKQTFQMFDSNSDGRVTIKQLVEIARINVDLLKHGHRQIHLGLTAKQGEMQVMWVTTPDSYKKPVVHYGHFPSQLSNKVSAISSTYNVGHLGFKGSIYKAVLQGLESGKRYYYRVGDQESLTYSAIKHFNGPPRKGQQLDQINIAVFGDMGTFAPLGHLVMNQIVRDNLVKPVDFVFLTGDIAYAGMNKLEDGETEPIWDLFGQLTESFAAYAPFMPGVGNHERYYDYKSYTMRYDLPKIYPKQTNLWFSFDFGQVHVTHFSSQHPYNYGSEQYSFLQQDLRQASQNPNTKWIILGVHRAFYCSDQCQFSNVTDLAAHLEELVYKYKVDIVQTGHLHCYQRTWPTYKGKALTQGHKQDHFYNPKAPVYVVQGSAGALIREKWINPKPEWSLRRMLHYGYGRIQIKGKTLKYQYIAAANSKVVDEWYITKE